MIRIIADTTSCISPAEAEQLGIDYLPQIINFGEESFRDDKEMDPITFLKRQRVSPVLPKTAAPPPVLYNPIYQKYFDMGDTMIVLCPSSNVSGTFRSASVAAQDFPNADIRIIDTQIIAGGLGSLVKQSLKWVAQGLNADTIVENIKEMASRERIYFMVDTLEYLYKGGRIGAAKALFGSLLQMKPILTFRDGTIQPFESQRTHKRALARLKEVVGAACPSEPASYLSIMHGDSENVARQCAEDLGACLGIPTGEIAIYDLTPAILTHSGPGVIAISFFVQPGQ